MKNKKILFRRGRLWSSGSEVDLSLEDRKKVGNLELFLVKYLPILLACGLIVDISFHATSIHVLGAGAGIMTYIFLILLRKKFGLFVSATWLLFVSVFVGFGLFNYEYLPHLDINYRMTDLMIQISLMMLFTHLIHLLFADLLSRGWQGYYKTNQRFTYLKSQRIDFSKGFKSFVFIAVVAGSALTLFGAVKWSHDQAVRIELKKAFVQKVKEIQQLDKLRNK